MTQHADLTVERWAQFSLDQQILMIANEMNRGSKLARDGDLRRLRNAYERVLQLVDLTVSCRPRRGMVRELLRWRDLVAALYLSSATDPDGHDALLRCLLRTTPAAALQIPHI